MNTEAISYGPCSQPPPRITIDVQMPAEKEKVADRERGARLRSLRKAAGLTQPQLAVKADVGLASVQRGERGMDLQMGTMRAIAEALGTTVAELMGSDPDDDLPSSEGFRDFLEWLSTAQVKPIVEQSPWILRELRRMNPPEADLPAESYRQMMYAFLMAEGEK